MIARTLLCVLAALPVPAVAGARVCPPASRLKVVPAVDVPDAPADPVLRLPKTLYRQGERYARIEEAPSTDGDDQFLTVVAEPDVWTANLANRTGNYQKDPGPTFLFRAAIFGDPNIESRFINTLEFGCEVDWLSKAGAKRSRVNHPEIG